MLRPLARILVGLGACLLLASPARAGFLVTDLGVLSGGSVSKGNAINASGVVAGTSQIGPFQDRAVLGGKSALMDLGSLEGGRTSRGYGINNGGQVAGDGEILVNGRFQTHAFRSQGAGALQDVGVLDGDIGSAARGINSSGQIAGWSTAASGRTQAMIALAPKALVAIQGLGGVNSKGFAINDSGTVVGEAETVGGLTHAFRTSGTMAMDLGTLPGAISSSARGINNNGDVVGFSSDSSSARAFLALGTGGPLINLGVLPFGSSSKAWGVNDSRFVVGQTDFTGADSRAFLWLPPIASTTPPRLYDLNDLILPGAGWTLLSATAINQSNQITGYGLHEGQIHGFRLDLIPGQGIGQPAVVPEPGTAIMALIGGLSLAAWRLPRLIRRRN